MASIVDFDRIFRLSSGGVAGALHVRKASDETWARPGSDTNNVPALIAGDLLPPRPLRFSWSAGDFPMDQITTELVRIRILSERVFECFDRHHFTGWSSFPVEMSGRNGVSVPNYRGLSITGRCGPIDNSNSVRTSAPPRLKQGDADIMIGLYFDPESWDGSDIFSPKGAPLFVVEEVKSALEHLGATNFCFTPLTKVENHRATLRLRHLTE